MQTHYEILKACRRQLQNFLSLGQQEKIYLAAIPQKDHYQFSYMFCKNTKICFLI